ncbi:hypothetical protein [Flavobacterium sp. CS20]|uniref:hypothetical protein n=1 Tax=Flavobacterium sp. CS20 TaxID=2775246 RepID=UPI001B3A2B09|nr:hypothetical protein [Flavobacterium sp. CS20]QTY27313.1 hypothetical protein IGB25_01650 [Flavobacterium sp. CS20]
MKLGDTKDFFSNLDFYRTTMIIILILDILLKKTSKSLIKSKKINIDRFKKNGTKIEIDTKNCDIIINDEIIKPSFYESSSIYGIKFLKRAKYNVREKKHVQSKLICRYNDDLVGKVEFFKLVNIDSSILKYEICRRSKIDVYTNKGDLENYYIDLEFLKE